jgi:hypothetical protein
MDIFYAVLEEPGSPPFASTSTNYVESGITVPDYKPALTAFFNEINRFLRARFRQLLRGNGCFF